MLGEEGSSGPVPGTIRARPVPGLPPNFYYIKHLFTAFTDIIWFHPVYVHSFFSLGYTELKYTRLNMICSPVTKLDADGADIIFNYTNPWL